MINEEELSRGSAFRRLEGGGEGGEPQLGVTAEMMQVVLIMKLLHRQNILYRQLQQQLPSSDSGSGNDKPPRVHHHSNDHSSSSPHPSPPELPTRTRPAPLLVLARPDRCGRE